MSLFKRSSENQEIMKNKEHLTHNQVVPGSSPVELCRSAPYVIWKTVNGVVKTANSMESTAEFLADIADIHTVLKYGVNTISDLQRL